MGRWAQRTRRGGDAQAPAPLPPPPPTLLDVQSNGTSFTAIFDTPVTTTATNVPDSGLQVDGFDVVSVNSVAGPFVDFNTSGPTITAGLPWALTSQPAWLNEAIAGPSSGTTI